MKRIKRKAAALLSAVLMCLSAVVPTAAQDGTPPGDTDKSNALSAIDKVIVMRMMLGITEKSPTGDVNCDTFIALSDISALNDFIMGVCNEITFCFPSYVELPETLSLGIGASKQLEPITYPEACLESTLSWESSDEKVASVKDGLITALAEGTADITAHSKGGASAKCTVTVTKPAPVLTPATITGVTTNLRVRSIPSTDGEILGSFGPNQKITVIGEISNGWYHVTGADRLSGKTVEGYSSADYITLDSTEPPDTVTTEPPEVTGETDETDESETEAPEVTGEFAEKIATLRVKFPEGKYWNHTVGEANTPDSCTDTPCDHHKGECEYSGACGCNSFSSAIQCMGFAFKIGYDLYGTSPREWTAVDAKSISPGDYLRYNGHSMIVLTVTEEGITVVEANYDNKCGIFWDRFISMQKLNAYTLDLRRHKT